MKKARVNGNADATDHYITQGEDPCISLISSDEDDSDFTTNANKMYRSSLQKHENVSTSLSNTECSSFPSSSSTQLTDPVEPSSFNPNPQWIDMSNLARAKRFNSKTRANKTRSASKALSKTKLFMWDPPKNCNQMQVQPPQTTVEITDDESDDNGLIKADKAEQYAHKESVLKKLLLEPSGSGETGWYIDKERGKLSTEEIPMTSVMSDQYASGPEIITAPPISERTQHYERVISGVTVKIPVNPYTSQMAVMNKVIQGCSKKQHCLLESPTGSGKTLALLCGALAWQEHFAVTLAKEREREMYGEDCAEPEVCCQSASPEKSGKEQCKRVPKIYYGTRTHRQIQQVVRELRKTVYRHCRMTILSSREHTCIRSEPRNKTELCNELLDPAKGKSCEYHTENNKKLMSTYSALDRIGFDTPWDIEDLVTLGRKHATCPYFAARGLMVEAEIIFCPYNYLIDPNIRESMAINLKNEVIILDEAHNIEDVCRDVASVNLREDHLLSLAQECEILMAHGDKFAYGTIKNYSRALVKFMKGIAVNPVDVRGELASSVYWIGTELTEMLNISKIGVSEFFRVQNAGQTILQDIQQAKETNRTNAKQHPHVLGQSSKRILETLLFSLEMLQSEAYANDYRGCVVETAVQDCTFIEDNTWYSTDSKKTRTVRALKLLCMNSAIIFAPLAKSARCVILASGTLTPTSTFESELGTVFQQSLNANHVIHRDQVCAATIGKGPTGVSLRATYANVNQFNFQDELGLILLSACQSIPHGILCFFSSYHMMNTQIQRWKLNNTWNNIERTKHIFIEPRMSTELSGMMQAYRETIEETTENDDNGVNGALLLAVFRGKVAEGIDFSDNEARCVLTVGIPYAVRNNPHIKMKMEYNDKNKSRGLLTGSEWYTVQAFRALNQAVGRCIRHRHDWGALLLVDARLESPDFIKYLPKWVRTMMTNIPETHIKEKLRQFVANRQEADRLRPE